MPSWTSGTLIGSVQRALRLLDVVADASRPITVKALSSRSGLSLGTTYNLVRTLIHEGYLRGDHDGLLLGPRFPGLSDQDWSGVYLARVRSALNQVSDELGAAAYLSRYADGEISVVDIVDAATHPRVALWVGIQDSAHATALGKQILANLDDNALQDYLSRHQLPELTQHTISDRRSLLRALSVAADGAIDRQEYALGSVCLAVPVLTDDTVAALAISLPADDRRIADLTDVTDQLRAIAATLSLQLSAERAFS
ncbi:IclR family transcriptional regulator [Microlunatus soli]|uniref:DNA-binding transcriptional regulator, IclR family n=1 Tax=Microlunatus soli TaxID=630515 RepID=A0A1H1S5J2_9ACTN|nr:IclR family transcriptional regulator C-terminal domain-containing protein [Microlunatus soli]SDS43016.1 DNA-binding transcriptional regulator, IclR family [Microlunatus soli]